MGCERVPGDTRPDRLAEQIRLIYAYSCSFPAREQYFPTDAVIQDGIDA
jgi:hypothetical protein